MSKEFLDQNGLNTYDACVKRAISNNTEKIKKVKNTVDKIPETYSTKIETQEVRDSVDVLQETVNEIPEVYVTKQQLQDELYGILKTEY